MPSTHWIPLSLWQGAGWEGPRSCLPRRSPVQLEKRGPPLEPPCTAHVVCSITGVSPTRTTADRMPEVTEGPQAWPKMPKPTTLTASPARKERRARLGGRLCPSKAPNPLCPSGCSKDTPASGESATGPHGTSADLAAHLLTTGPRHRTILQPSFPCRTTQLLLRVPGTQPWAP